MKRFWALAAAMTLVLTACGGGGGGSGSANTIRVALGDIESVETLALMIALDRVRERGTEVELIELADEDLANQAVVGGQADVGLGAPYALIQGSGAPLRIFCQLAVSKGRCQNEMRSSSRPMPSMTSPSLFACQLSTS